MTVTHNGKTPGRFWYFRQRTGAFLHTFKDTSTARQARVMRRDAVISLGAIGTGVAILNISYAAMVPFLVTFGAPAAGVTGLLMGYKSWRNARQLQSGRVARAYVRDAESLWLDKKARPSLLARIKAAIATKLTRQKKAVPVVSPAITQSKTTTTLDAAQASDAFDSASAPAQAVDPQQEESARKRAEARHQRRNSGNQRFR